MTAVAGRAGPFLNVAADRQGSYTLDASTAGPSLLVTSNAFTIFGLAASLSIVQQPTSGDLSQVALVNDPSVEILDVYDDLIATTVVFTVQPTGDVLENAVLPTMPEVHIHDQFGGLVSTGPHSALTVALSRTGGTGVLQGTATAGASGGVVDTYAGLVLTLSSTTYRLRATLLHGSNPTVDSDMFTIFAIATSIVFSTQPAATNVLTDQDLTVAPVVEILDTLGARVVLGPHAVLSVAVAKSAGGLGLLSQGTTVVSASAGLAGPFSGIQFDRQSTYSLQATTGVPALSVTSNSFVVHGFAFELQFQTQPVGNCRPVDPLVTQPVVRLFDSYGDQILTGPHSMLDVTLTETLTPAVVTGTTTVTASGGDAVFTDVGIDRGGDFVARASTAPPTLTVNSAPFIIYGVASHLSFCRQPVANVLPHELFPTQPEVCVLDVHSNVVEYGPDAVRRSWYHRRRSTRDIAISFNGTYQMTIDSALPAPALPQVLSADVTIDVPANSPPVFTVPSSLLSTNEDVPLDISCSVADPDASLGTNEMRVTVQLTPTDGLSAEPHATPACVTFVTWAGLDVVTGTGGVCNEHVVVDALVDDLNAALAGLRLVTETNWHGSVLVDLTIDDRGNFGFGGVKSDSKTITVTADAVNDAPTVDAAQPGVWTAELVTLVEDTPLLLSPLTVGDVDSPDLQQPMTVVLGSDFAKVSISLDFQGTFFEGTSVTIEGSIVDVNAALAAVTVQGLLDRVGADTLSLYVDDKGHSGIGGLLSETNVLDIELSQVNDPPTWTVPALAVANATLAFDEHLALDIVSVIGDVDVLELGTSGLLEAQLWTNGDMGVRLATWAGLGNITAPSDGSETPVHVSGSLADIE